MSNDGINNANLEQPEESKAAHFVLQYFAATNNTNVRMGVAKNAVPLSMFCDKSFTGCNTSSADSVFLL